MVQHFHTEESLPVIRSSKRGAVEGIVVNMRHHGAHARMRGMWRVRERRPQTSKMMEVTPRSQGGRCASIAPDRHRRGKSTRYGGCETADAAGG